MTEGPREVFLPEHAWQEDAALLDPPAQGPFTLLTLFVCTYVAKLGHLHIGFDTLTTLMCRNPHGPLLAINSNFGHACQPGYERLLKVPRPPPERRVPTRGRARKVQGDGTCFNSAIEPILAVEHPGVDVDKVYKVKCFPTTGETQIPGVICSDLSDGRAVLEVFVAYLNELKVGDALPLPASHGEGRHLEAESPPGARPRHAVTILSEQPKMLNYKFRVIRRSPRVLVNLRALATHMLHLELAKAVEGTRPGGDPPNDRLPGVLPPYPVRETKPPTDDVKVSFRFRGVNRAPRINIFQEGKVNILGADSVEMAQKIYAFFVELFTVNWAALVCLQPRRDLERRPAARVLRPTATPVQPPSVRLSDAEVDAILAGSQADAICNIIADLSGWDCSGEALSETAPSEAAPSEAALGEAPGGAR